MIRICKFVPSNTMYMKRLNYPKKQSILLLSILYILALAIGIFMFRLSITRYAIPAIYAMLIADLTATLIVWFFDILLVNVSVYDPYWSVIPPVLFTAFAIHVGHVSLPGILLLLGVWIWGIRLTGNWARTFRGLGFEDWRYTRYREMLPKAAFELTHFFGLVLMPTLLVFACMVPGFRVLETTDPANPFTWLGFAMCLGAALIQFFADDQRIRFRETHPGEVCSVGLWAGGRHPNYFGEILMWWGVWAIYASLSGIDALFLSPVAMTALFLFISIPMMEHRQLENKPGYDDYRKQTRLLI